MFQVVYKLKMLQWRNPFHIMKRFSEKACTGVEPVSGHKPDIHAGFEQICFAI